MDFGNTMSHKRGNLKNCLRIISKFTIWLKGMYLFWGLSSYEIELTRLGTKITLDIAGICSPKDIERDLDYIQALFRAEDVRMSYADGKVILDIQVFEDDNEQSQPIGKDPLMLPVGFDEESKDIFVDMHRNAGLLINGVRV